MDEHVFQFLVGWPISQLCGTRAGHQDFWGYHLFPNAVGGDGHVTFNEPGPNLASRMRFNTLAYDTVPANAARFFGGEVEQVSKTPLTVVAQTITKAKEGFMLASDAG
ncbi:hypothetical protein PG994_009949 [Apiospora phragmitis]|uniref:Uncharacterized protein n=1 Tax=Apiospora phragmitis TaxID=2905665 RepID=A0ABR1TNM7_9PEZI